LRYPETGGPPDLHLEKERPIFKDILPIPKELPAVPGTVLEERRNPELRPVLGGPIVGEKN
jgi:hypothetical protein